VTNYSFFSLAEEEGFEPPALLGAAVFKTAAFDHSATPPGDPQRWDGSIWIAARL